MFTNTTIDWPAMADLTPRRHAQVMDGSLTALAFRHHQRNIPRHFLRGAGQRYEYVPRDKRYLKMKMRKYGSNLDNVKTGATRAAALTVPQITGNSKKKVLVLRLPFASSGRLLDAAAAARLMKAGRRRKATFNVQQLSAQQQVRNRIAEMEAIAADEVVDQGQFIEREYFTRAAQLGRRRRIKVS